ncbi:E3 ubiquitin/ISG15 ligase TRIM25 isoform X7 [Erythrolamprus reginae]|uniref:E3 ubiquitin/ISG15 ligase TRIM25 isoform X7 n=1 Tax=Erythrolamprus reginae TaxID=121349 RepID=UPI00396C555D
MAKLVDGASMEEELTCSICLCVFETPVTTPCGHNFCQFCLEMTWMEGGVTFNCPQCRASFETRPELKKNTVLCKVVEQFQASQDVVFKGTSEEEEEKKKADSSPTQSKSPLLVGCDNCLTMEAAKTCLTCMASFCQEHLRPHLESPAFKNHQLVPPVDKLEQMTCQAHCKLLEFFCQDHGVSICYFCLLSHKTCSSLALKDAKTLKKAKLKNRLTELGALNDKTAKALEQVRVQRKQLTGTTSQKLDLLKLEFLEIVALIHEEEKNSWQKIKAEEKKCLDKFEYVHNILGKKKNEIQRERDEIEMTLAEMDDITFLKKSTKLQKISFNDVFVPKIELDQNLLGAVHQKACNLKHLNKRFLGITQEENKKGQRGRPAKRAESPKRRVQSCSKAETKNETTTLDSFLTKPREELLKFASQFTLDHHSAHKNILLLEKFTKISVTEMVQDYQQHPHRFLSFSQVLSFQCFKKGIHYWEVDLSNNNFCAVGICYGSIPRRGPESRLGRNNSSWCIEWVNNKVSAWHNGKDTSLPSNKATKIGVLLNYDGGFVIFFGVTEKKSFPLYKFKIEFTEAIYSAFWVFSNGATISACQLKS